jgi:hypothetical protein
MIPKYAFRVIVTSKLGERLQRQSHNYETLPGGDGLSRDRPPQACGDAGRACDGARRNNPERRERARWSPLGERRLTGKPPAPFFGGLSHVSQTVSHCIATPYFVGISGVPPISPASLAVARAPRAATVLRRRAA